MKLLRQLNEAGAPSAIAEVLSEHVTKSLDVEEMRRNRGRHYGRTQFYQLRVKPTDNKVTLESILTKLQDYLRSEKSSKLGIASVQINQRARNSGKYSSVSFKIGSTFFEAVVAKGGNAGENFEKALLLKMDNLVAKGAGSLSLDDAEHARMAFAALKKADPALDIGNVASVSPRVGSTRRSGDMNPDEMGAIIADLIIKLKNGDKKYVSVKNSRGTSVAQFGLVKAFTDDLKVNTESDEWRTWLEPFRLDINKINKGLHAAKMQTDVSFKDIESRIAPVKPNTEIYKILEKMWGQNYYLLKELPNGAFIATKIDKKYVDSKLLKNLKMYEVRYPMKDRKQINVYLQSDYAKYKIEIRNPRGGGEIKPTQIQLTVLKGSK